MTNKDASKYYADENVVRIIAVLAIVVVSVSLWQNWILLLFLLSADFALRAFTYLPAPLAAVAKVIAVLFKLKPQPIFAPPKKFAAAIGFVFVLTIPVLLFLNYLTAAYIVGGILIFFALLESVFKICVGCYVYNTLVAPVMNRKSK